MREVPGSTPGRAQLFFHGHCKEPKTQTVISKTLHRKQETEYHEPHKKWDELRCSGRVISSCSTSSTHRITLIKTSVLGGGSEEEIGVMTIRQTEHIRGKL